MILVMSLLPILLAALPFFVFIVLLFWGKLKMIWISLIALIFVGATAGFYWKIKPDFFIASVGKGFFVALDIFFIIFGAIFFLEILKETKVTENIGFYLESISKDLRIQVILLAWFFENFLEGTAGFGTPATVVAPLLIGLGINPLSAVVLSLLGNSTAGVFGAAGAPIKIGFGELAGSQLPFKASLYGLVGIIIPVFMLWFLVKGKEDQKRSFLEMLPFALWSGLVFAASSVLTVFLGPEFPSILGSALSLVIILLSIKTGLFVPKRNSGFISSGRAAPEIPLKKTIFPYIVLISLLIIGKVVLGPSGLSVPLMVKHTFSFFNPGFVLILAGIVTILFYKVSTKTFFNSSKIALEKSIEPFLVIVFMSSMAQIMVNSAQNISGMKSMIDFLVIGVRNAFLPLWAPLIGAFGSFLTGSVTISNLMFGNFFAAAARELNFNVDKILALAVVGGAVGNMIALADILIAEAVVGIKHREKDVIKGVIVPCLICIGLLGLIGLSI
ncbi:MAG: Lactate transporter, LctP family [Candidatus Woesebacteria bacterium GW2011_GWD1_41_12]|uniref:L-lactate permease n=2 Tax=Candidatus Woeseibacteriota TaxID=1752722 RepID=A0A0G0USC0_9BACT|nr:MAG: Lactate transporter, LctP family [Candidatus Woesebacteria bacterium GW2011_GWD1_41_12]